MLKEFLYSHSFDSLEEFFNKRSHKTFIVLLLLYSFYQIALYVTSALYMDLLVFILMTCSYLYYDLFHIEYCNGSCGMLNKVSSINTVYHKTSPTCFESLFWDYHQRLGL
jgi:hypothetical protein